MNLIMAILNPVWVERLGWTLVHFLWQGLAAACLLLILLMLSRRAGAKVRYLMACGTMAAMAAAPVVTLLLSQPAGPPPQIGSASPAMATSPVPILPAQPPAVSEVPARELRARTHPLLPWIVGCWVMGVAIAGLWHAGGWLCVRSLRRHRQAPPPECMAMLEDLMQRMGIGWAVQLVRSAHMEVPAVIGWLRPMILMPASALSGLTPTQLEAVLAHELAHVRRHDYLVNLLQAVVETLLFYHPAVWWISGCIRNEREYCCDDVAAEVCGNRLEYLRALSFLEQARSEPGLALAATGGSLLSRVQRLAGLSHDRTSGLMIVAAVLGLCVAILLGPAAAGQATQVADRNKMPATQPDRDSAVRLEDLKVIRQDYRISAIDLVTIGIMDLMVAGVETVCTARVTEEGTFALPIVGDIKVVGKTGKQAQQSIVALLIEKRLMANPQVAVTVLEKRARSFRILGDIKKPGDYALTEADFRLLRVLKAAELQTGARTVRILRKEADGSDRTIEVPIAPLLAGERKYNIVVRPDDTIIVPSNTPKEKGERAEEMYVQAPFPAKVGAMFVKSGEVVEKGQTLARLDTQELELKIDETKRQAHVLEAKAEKLQADGRSNEARIAQHERVALLQALKLFRSRLEQGSIEAPMTGRVTVRVRPGDAAKEGDTLFEIVSP